MWKDLFEEFERIARESDCGVIWSFAGASRPSHTVWSVFVPSSEEVERELWKLFAIAGASLQGKGLAQLIFPAKLIAEPCPERRWLAALRHSGTNVDRLSPSLYRTEHGIIHSVARASAMLCRKLDGESRRSRQRRSRRAANVACSHPESSGGAR